MWRVFVPASPPRGSLFSPEWRSNDVVDADGNVVPNYTMFSAVVAEPAQTAVLGVGLSMEAWETVASQKPDRAGSSSFQSIWPSMDSGV